MSSPYPYPGLRPFKREETDIFFGREEHSDELLNCLEKQHFLAVSGLSGCGKSSLVKTGLIPNLQAGYLSNTTRWKIAEMRPENKPFANLTATLIEALGEEYKADLENGVLKRGAFSLQELLITKPLPDKASLLIVCDQFEEIFRYDKETVSSEAAAFIALLLASSSPYLQPNGESFNDIYVVITMRSDYLGQCATFIGLAEAINNGLYLTPRLNREQLRSAIEEPALVFGGEVEAKLIVELLEDAENNQDQLPLLQHVLMRLWDKASQKAKPIPITLADYQHQSIQTLKNALSYHADEAYNDLNEQQQRIAQQIFCRLTGAETGKNDTRNPTQVIDLVALTDQNLEQLEAVLKPFRQAGRCFLMPPLEEKLEDKTMIDISHESLIRNWTRLETWTKEEIENAKTYQRLEDRALEWEKGNASLLQSPELEIFQQWWQKNNPTEIWAKRYEEKRIPNKQNFSLVKEFLAKSNQATVLELVKQSHFLTIADYGGHYILRERDKLITSLQEDTRSPWSFIEMRPSNNPFTQLSESLLCAFPDMLNKYDSNGLQQELQKSSLSLHHLLTPYLLKHYKKLLIICEKFEEIFRYSEEKNTAKNFVELLLTSRKKYSLSQNNNLENNIYIIIVLRSDFLGDCSIFNDLAESVSKNLYLIPLPNRDQLFKEIKDFCDKYNFEIEQDLINKLIDDAINNIDGILLLRYYLNVMIKKVKEKRLTLCSYIETGGLFNFLSNYADEIFYNLSIEQQIIAEIIFRNLLEFRESRYIRPSIRLREIVELSSASVEEVVTVIDKFRQMEFYFVSPSIDVDLTYDSIIDISHEGLIRQWRRLIEWSEKEAENAKTYQRLEDRALEWNKESSGLLQSPELEIFQQWWQQEKPTALWARRYGQYFSLAEKFLNDSQTRNQKYLKEKSIRRYYIIISVIIVCVILSVLAGVNYLQFKKESSLNLELNKTTIKLAEEKQRLISTQKTLEAEVAEVKHQMDFIKQLEKGQVDKKPLVYVQFQGNITREFMNELRESLKNNFNIPGAERVPGNYISEVKYFSKDSKDRAENLAELVKSFFLLKGCPLKRLDAKFNNATHGKESPPELWLAAEDSCKTK